VVDEIRQADKELKDYLIEAFTEIDASRSFHGAIPGHFVQYGNLAESRTELTEEKIRTIIRE